MTRRQVAEQIVENYPYSDSDAAVAHIEAALCERDERAARIAKKYKDTLPLVRNIAEVIADAILYEPTPGQEAGRRG